MKKTRLQLGVLRIASTDFIILWVYGDLKEGCIRKFSKVFFLDWENLTSTPCSVQFTRKARREPHGT